MFKRIEEPTVLFISILKWVVLATVIGIIVGLSTAVFLKILNWSIASANRYPFYFLFLPASLFLSATFSAIGLVSLLAGAANTPIAASIMAVELFGAEIAPYAAVACVISFLMTGHRSVYPSQVLAIKKSSSLDVEIGKEVEGVTPEFKPRGKSLTSAGIKLVRKVKRNKEKE